MRPPLIVPVVLAMLIAAEGAEHAWAVQTLYSVKDLGDLLGGADYSEAYALNESAQAVGRGNVPSEVHATLFSGGGTTTDLGVLQADHHFSIAWDINDSGVAVGMSSTYSNQAENLRPVMFANGTVEYLGSFGGDYGAARGINAAGQAVGISRYASGARHAFVWHQGTMTDIDDMGPGTYDFSDAYDINENGQVVGDYSRVYGTDHAFLWEQGTGMTDLDTLPGMVHSMAYKINNVGQVVGESSTVFTPGWYSLGRACLWENGSVIDLGLLPGNAYSIAWSINDSGLAVGAAYTDPEHDDLDHRAFIWDSVDGIQDLNGMLDSSGAGWTLLVAQDINSRGQIVGWGVNPSGSTHAFLLTPAIIPEPSTLWIWSLLAALGIFAGHRRRR